MLRLKTESEIRAIWRSGQIGGAFLDDVSPLLKPGVSTAEIDAFAHSYLAERGATPAFFGYNGYTGAVCTSFNEQVVHGIPGERVLRAGDIITVDIGTTLDGFISDTARTYFVGDGPVPPDIERLLHYTKVSLDAGIAAARAGQPLRLVSRAVQTVLEQGRLAIIRELTGHGVGFNVHEEPTVYNFDPGGRKPLIADGLVIAIEPMAALGRQDILLDSDNWTYFMADGSPSAHFEHTIGCWNGEVYVLTDPHDERARRAFGGAEAKPGQTVALTRES